jgi:hypothetical protein
LEKIKDNCGMCRAKLAKIKICTWDSSVSPLILTPCLPVFGPTVVHEYSTRWHIAKDA